jgi:hypothetical protein
MAVCGRNSCRRWRAAKHQAAGFPEIASTRFAISEPALTGQPTGASGYAISRVDPAGRVIADPQVPYPSYAIADEGLAAHGNLLARRSVDHAAWIMSLSYAVISSCQRLGTCASRFLCL